MTTTEKTELCENCKEIKPVAYTDSVGREYCAACFGILPVNTPGRMLDYLVQTIPFQVGDKVECRTAGVLYDGIGVIDEVSIDPEKWGSPVFPSFHVRITHKATEQAPDELWYWEKQLKRADA